MFFGTWFFFSINWVIAFFSFGHFFVLINHHFFNKGVWVNLYKFTFSIPPLFHSQANKKERNQNLFYPPTFPSSHHFLSFHFSTPPTKRTINVEVQFFSLMPLAPILFNHIYLFTKKYQDITHKLFGLHEYFSSHWPKNIFYLII